MSDYKKGDIIKFNSGKTFIVLNVKEGGMGIVYLCRRKYGTQALPRLQTFKTLKDKYVNSNNIYETFISIGYMYIFNRMC